MMSIEMENPGAHPAAPQEEIILIRSFVEEDRDSLVRIFLEARRRAFYWCDPSDFRAEDFESQTAGEVITVASDLTGKALGFVSVWVPDRFVHQLFIDVGHQGRGLGGALLDSLESWLPGPYQLKCLTQNETAHRFYLKRGWTELSRHLDGLGEYALMEYTLPQSV